MNAKRILRIRNVILPVVPLLVLTAVLAHNYAIDLSIQAAPDPAKINLVVAPETLIADGQTYDALFLRLETHAGSALPFPADAVVQLWSSDSDAFNVPSTLELPVGETALAVPVITGVEPGEAVVTVALEGAGSDMAAIRSIAPTGASVPYGLKLDVLPDRVFQEGTQPGHILISLLGSNDAPAITFRDVEVTLTSSNHDVVKLDKPRYTIPAGQSSVQGQYQAGRIGEAKITAQSNGFSPAEFNVEVTAIGTVPNQLTSHIAPSPLLPGHGPSLVVIQALAENGAATILPCGPINITSDLRGAVVLQSQAVVPSGFRCGDNAAYAEAWVDLGPRPKPASLSITQPGVLGVNLNVPAYTRAVDQVGASFAFSSSASGAGIGNFLVIQPLDSQGLPVPVAQETPLLLFSEQADLPSGQTFRPGESLKVLPITVLPNGDTISVEVRIPGVPQAVATAQLAEAALKVKLESGSSSVASGLSTQVKAIVTLEGRPVRGATLNWSTTSGNLVTTEPVTNVDGVGTAEFVPQSGATNQVVVRAKFGNLLSSNTSIAVNPIAASGGARATPHIEVFGVAIPVLAVLGIAMAILVVYIVLRFLPIDKMGKRVQDRAKAFWG